MKIPPKLREIKLNGSTFINVIGAIIVLYLVVVLGQTVKRNYDLGRQIDALKAQMVVLQGQKDELAYNIQYYKTDSFRDREARSQLGLQLPGENVVIIPHNSPSQEPSSSTIKKAAAPKSNFGQWLNFLGGSS